MAWTAYSNAPAGRSFIFKNADVQMQTDSNGKAESIVLELAAGDKVYMGANGAYAMTWYGAFAHNAFTGYLIAPE